MALLRRRHLLVMIALVAVLAAGFLAWRLCRPPALYRMTILPTLGGLNTFVESLNDRGQVVGLVHDRGGSRPFLWDRTHGIQDLGFIGGYHRGLRINNAGQIAGTMPPTDPNSQEAFLWESGKGRTLLGTLGGRTSWAHEMNNHGQIVGTSTTADESPHAFLWDQEIGMRELTAPDGSHCWPVSINDAGQILVRSLKQPLAQPRLWFLLGPSGPRLLDAMLPHTWLRSINASSCIAGTETSSGRLPRLLLRDEHGTWRRLFPMNSHGETTRLNDRNQIAYSESAPNRWEHVRDRLPRWLFRPRLPSYATESYLWDPIRGRIPLNRYLSGMKRFNVADLNNNGCIIGTAETEDGTTRSVLLEPIPERWGE